LSELTVSKTFVEGKPEYTWIMTFLAQERLYRKFRFSKSVVGGPDMLPLGKTRKLRWNKLSVEVVRTEDTTYGFELDDRRSLLAVKIHTLDDSAMSALVDEAKARYMNSHSTDATVHTLGFNVGHDSAFRDICVLIHILSVGMGRRQQKLESDSQSDRFIPHDPREAGCHGIALLRGKGVL
jgi:hypothetical protein